MQKCDEDILTPERVQYYAISLLARREYSRVALRARLLDKGADASIVDNVLDELHARGYQSDERFIQSLVRVRIAQGKGPRVLFQEAQEHNMSSELLASAIQAESPDWVALAAAALAKRFDEKPVTLKEKSKQYRFLMMRGFEPDHIKAVL